MHHSIHTTSVGDTEIIFINVPNSRAVYASFNIFSGYRHALAQKREFYHIPHILEHLVFEGSEKYPTGKELVNELMKRGSYYNGHTTNYVNQYVSRFAPEELNRILGVMFDMIYRPILPEQGLEEEREVVARELDENKGDYGLVANFMNGSKSLPDSTVDLIEQEELIAVPTLDEIKTYHQKFYTAANTQIVIAGDIPPEKRSAIKATLKHELSQVPIGKKQTLKELKVVKPEIPALPIETPSDISTLNVSLAFTLKGKLIGKEFQPLGLFGSLIGAPDHDSIYHYLRKKGLLYSLGASTATSLESYSLEIDFVCDREQYGRVLAELLLKLKEYSHTPIDADTLQNFKETLAGGFLIGCETPTDYADWYEGYIIHQEPLESPESAAASVMKVTAKDVQSMVEPLIENENLHIALMGGEASSYLEITDDIRKAVFAKDTPDVDELLASIDAKQEKLSKSRPFATWVARIGLTLLAISSFIPNIVTKDGKTISMWSMGWDNGWYGINAAIVWLIISTLSMYVLRFGAVAKEVFAILAIYVFVLWVGMSDFANLDADIPTIWGEAASLIMVLMPIFIMALAAGDTWSWIKQKLTRRNETSSK